MNNRPQITIRPADHLLIARWAEHGIEEDFPFHNREIMNKAHAAKCWRWLLDYRIHGDVTEYNARDLYGIVLPDTWGRCTFVEVEARVAVLVGPAGAVLTAQLPRADFQRRRNYRARIFTDEGLAVQWLLGAG